MPFFPLIVFQFHSFYVLCLVSRFTGRFEHPKGSWKIGISLCSTFSLISIRMSRLLSARNLLATHPHPPRPIQIQGMPIGHSRSYRRRKSLRENKNVHRTVSVSVVRQTSKSFTDHPTLPVVGNIHEIPGSKIEGTQNRICPISLTSDFPLPLYTPGARSQSWFGLKGGQD